MASDRPSNAELLYLIALHLRIVNPRTQKLEPRYERMLRPPDSDPMSATEWRARYGDDDVEAEPLDMRRDPTHTPPMLRGDESAETLATIMEDANENEREFPQRDHLVRPAALEPPPMPAPDDEYPSTRRRPSRATVKPSGEEAATADEGETESEEDEGS
jgi:hypothetical protein